MPNTSLTLDRTLFCVIQRARNLRNNHGKFESFGWHGRPRTNENVDEDFAIVYYKTRDALLLEQSNAKVIEAEMKPFEDFEDDDTRWNCRQESHNHWAVGYVDGYTIRCIDSDGNATEAIAKWFYLQDCLADYPVLDDDGYSELEMEATEENLKQACERKTCEDKPSTWLGDVWHWFNENESNELENRDDSGGYPSDESVIRCLLYLGYLEHGSRGAEDITEFEIAEARIEALRRRQSNQPGQLVLFK